MCTCRRFEALHMHTSEKEDRRANEWAVHVVLEKGMVSWRSFHHCLFCCAPAMLRLFSRQAFLFLFVALPWLLSHLLKSIETPSTTRMQPKQK